jgi:hypothetical protein
VWKRREAASTPAQPPTRPMIVPKVPPLRTALFRLAVIHETVGIERRHTCSGRLLLPLLRSSWCVYDVYHMMFQ